jgi:leucyl-tRNA synthetase
VTEDYENLSFNTAISQMMIFVNDVYKEKKISKLHAIGFLKLLNPICPHITEELYQTVFNKKGTIAYEEWPIYDEDKLKKEELTIVVQVNGKLRDKMVISTTLSEEEIKAQALQLNNVKPYLQDKELKRIIVVKNKLVNIVV